VDQIIKKLGNLDQVYLTGDLAEGRNSPFVDLIIVGEVDKPYLYQLIEKAEPLVQKKIRVGVYKLEEFEEGILGAVGVIMKLVG
jgi:predicted nucleotidyltransferase